MRKILFFILFIFINVDIYSQNNTEEKYLLTNMVNSLGVSSINIINPYLSPLQYSGSNYQYNFETYRYFQDDNLNLSRQNKLSLNGGSAHNPASTAVMMFVGMNYEYGIHYHFRPMSKLTVLAGGSWDADIALKYAPRNSNNPVSTEVSTNLNISGLAFYKFNFLKRNAMVQLLVQSPLLGCMFVPPLSLSYYEMFLLGNMENAIHFSSIHNKRGVNAKLLFHFPLNKSNIHIGVAYNGLKYSANDDIYKQENVGILIGTSFDVIRFSGRKNKAPSNFISITD